jgi:hypothetical protein
VTADEAPTAPEPVSIEEVLAAKQPAWAEVEVTLTDGRLAVFRFEAIGRLAYDALVAAHPFTDEAQAKWLAQLEADGVPPAEQRPLRWNRDTFGPALLSASCVSPRMTFEHATALWTSERFTESELARLWGACMVVNESGDGVRPKGGSLLILGSAASSR